MLVPEVGAEAPPPNLNPPKGAGAAAGVEGLLASSLGCSAGFAPNEKPPAAGAGVTAGAVAGVSLFSAGFAPKEKPEDAGAGAAAAGASFFSAGLAPNENPEEAGAGAFAAGALAVLSAGFPNENPDKGGLDAGVVEPAFALFPPSPEKSPPAALPALAGWAAVPLFPAGLSLFKLANEKVGIALLEDAAFAGGAAVLLFVLDCPNPPNEGMAGAGDAAGVVEPALLPAPNRLKAGFGAGV